MTPAIFHYIIMGVIVVGLVIGGVYLARNDTADPKRD